MAAVLDLPRSRTPEVEAVHGTTILFVPSADIAPVDTLYYEVMDPITSRVQHRPTFTQLRLLVALGIWMRHGCDYFLVSGGRTFPPDRETRPAAYTMAEWLIYHGVPERQIVIEDESLDTYQNVEFSLKRLEERMILNPKITSVSHRTQNRRLKHTFRAYGIEIETYDVLYSLGAKGELYELIFFLIHLIDPKGEGWFARRNRNNRRRAAAGY